MEYPEFKKFKEGQQKKNSDKESTSMAATFFTKSIKDNDKDNNVRFIIDSGATQHMIPKKELFKNLKPISKEIKAAGNSVLNAEGQGDFAIILEGSNKRTNAILTDILYAPDLTESLFSVSKVNNHGYDVLFKYDRHIFIQDQASTIIAESQREGRLYYLSTKRDQSFTMNDQILKTDSDVMTQPIDVLSPYILWYLYLGHLGAQNLK